MKKLLILSLSLISFFGYSQTLIDPTLTPTTARINAAISDAVAASGTDTYTGTKSGLTNVTDRAYSVKFPNTNTTSSTFNLNGSGAVTIRKFESGSLVNLVAGDISAGETKRLRYNGTYLVIEGGSGSGGSFVESVTGDGVDNTDTQNPVMDLLSSRTFTSADDLDQSDNLHKVYLNSASPFNVTVDALTTGSEVVLINIGSATVTLVNGSGVTMSGPTTILANESAIVLYKVSTAPIIRSSGTATLTDGHILVGNASNTATDVPMSGQATIANTGAVTLDNDAVIGKVLTGYTSGAGTVASTDNILQAIQKLNGNDALGWKVTGTTTGTGASTITYPIENGLTFGGSWTATGTGSRHFRINPAITGRNTANDILSGLSVDPTFSLTANSEVYAARVYKASATGGFLDSGSDLLVGNTGTTGLKFFGSTFTMMSGGSNLFLGASATVRMAIGGNGHVELGQSITQADASFTINNPENSTSAGYGIYLKAAVGLAANNAGANYYGMYSQSTLTSNWSNAANFYGTSYKFSFSPTASASTITIFDSNPTINSTSTATPTLYALRHRPTLTSVTGLTHYGVVIEPTAALSGFGLSAPTATLHVVGSIKLDANVVLPTVGNKISIKEGSGGFMGQTTLVSGTKAVTVSGVTTSTRCFTQRVSPSGTTLTIAYDCACTSNTVTIQADVAAGTINTADNSVMNYILYEPAP